MPNRIIKESICTSLSLNELSWFEEVLFYRLIVSCDDFGRYEGHPAVLRGKLFPLKGVTNKQVEDALDKLSKVGMVLLYEVCGRSYLQLTAWEHHQQKRAKHSKYPSPDDATLVAGASNCNQLLAIAPEKRETRNEKRESGNERVRFAPPSLEEVKAYCQERKNPVDPQRFIDFYVSKGWKVGNQPMKDWKAAIRTWENRDKPPNLPKKKGKFDDIPGLDEALMRS